MDPVLIHGMGMAVEQEGGRCTETNSDFIVANLLTNSFFSRLFFEKYNDSRASCETDFSHYSSSNEREPSNGNDFGHFSVNSFKKKD